MNYNLLIVDDDSLIREGLANTIPWKEHHINIIGMASDGEHAIKILQNNKVHMVITDIKMPFMDGMALAAYIHDHYPHIKIVLLSGYKEFDYALEALRLNVKDYLVKPIDDDKLITLMVKLKNEIKQELVERNKKNVQLKHKRLEGLKSLIHQAPQDKNNSILENVHGLNLPLNAYFQLAVIQCKDFNNSLYHQEIMEGNLLKFSIWNITNEFLSTYGSGVTFEFDKDEVLLLCYNHTSKDKLETSIEKILSHLYSYATKHLHTDLRIGVSMPTESVLTLYKAYEQCQKTFQFLPVRNPIPYILYEDVISIDQQLPGLMNEFSGELKALLKGAINVDAVKNLYDCLNQTLANKQLIMADQLQLLFSHIAIVTHQTLGPTKKDSINELLKSHMVELRQLHRPTELLEASYTYTSNYMKQQLQSNTGVHNGHIMKALDYLQANYKNEGLRLKHVASHIHVNPSYLSILFKKHLGSSFSEYLQKLRIEKAKELLHISDKRISEISDMIGFSNSQYFSSNFKSYTGLTPKEFRQQRQDKSHS